MLRLCLDCPNTFEAAPRRSRCPECQAAKDQARDAHRGTSTERGYGSQYQRNRRNLLTQPDAACEICGHDGDESNPLTADHIIPLAEGGTSDLWNLRVLCRRDNSSRGAQSDQDYRRRINREPSSLSPTPSAESSSGARSRPWSPKAERYGLGVTAVVVVVV